VDDAVSLAAEGVVDDEDDLLFEGELELLDGNNFEALEFGPGASTELIGMTVAMSFFFFKFQNWSMIILSVVPVGSNSPVTIDLASGLGLAGIDASDFLFCPTDASVVMA
jgi:hypothetical protein